MAKLGWRTWISSWACQEWKFAVRNRRTSAWSLWKQASPEARRYLIHRLYHHVDASCCALTSCPCARRPTWPLAVALAKQCGWTVFKREGKTSS